MYILDLFMGPQLQQAPALPNVAFDIELSR